jgi:hypothetical protein
MERFRRVAPIHVLPYVAWECGSSMRAASAQKQAQPRAAGGSFNIDMSP